MLAKRRLGVLADTIGYGPLAFSGHVKVDESSPCAVVAHVLHHRSRVCHFVIDVGDLDQATAFWTAALGATEDEVSPGSRQVYRKLRLPDSDIRVLLQKTDDEKTSKERMHLDLETDDVEAEVRRLEALGATRWDHQKERSFDFWVMRDPWLNEFCVLQTEFPELLAQRTPWPQ